MPDTPESRRKRSAAVRFVAADSLAWFLGVFGADWARYDFNVGSVDVRLTAAIAVAAMTLNATAGFCLGIYSRRFVSGSFDEAKMIAVGALISAIGLQVLVILIHESQVPRSVPLIAGATALVGMWGARVIGRASEHHRIDLLPADKAIILGAGNSGAQLVRQMRTDKASPLHPVAILDDDPLKRRMHIEGVPVVGTRRDLIPVARRSHACAVVIAIADADRAMISEVSAEAAGLGLKTFVLPPLRELLHTPLRTSTLKEVALSDILGREPIKLDVESIAGRIRGKRVLVTGAGGSVGSELCRLIHGFAPAELTMLDRDESALHAVQMSIYGRVTSNDAVVVLADIRDPEALSITFATRRPEVVFHAAALKHLPMLEAFPREAWLTNVVGTANVLRAARANSVGIFVNISTDKAADPSSVLGSSKRICERLTSAAGGDGLYVSVRFGNVLGSRGSVIPTFEAQIAGAGPVTVTHPDATRYFMTITEACQLVLQASTIGRPGEAMVLDMGVPVKIADIAKLLIANSGKDGVDIVYTGLRPGEKLHENLFSAAEPQNFRPIHRRIFHVVVPPLTLEPALSHLDSCSTPAEARRRLNALATTTTAVVEPKPIVAGGPLAIAG